MSSPYLFGVTTESLSRREHARRRKIARMHDCVYYSAEGRAWFATRGPQMGSPFDGAIERAVMAEVEAGRPAGRPRS